jgi:hypothetical protein
MALVYSWVLNVKTVEWKTLSKEVWVLEANVDGVKYIRI